MGINCPQARNLGYSHLFPLLHCAEMKNLQKDDDPFRTYTRKWQEGELSNYDYLMLLKHRSGNRMR